MSKKTLTYQEVVEKREARMKKIYTIMLWFPVVCSAIAIVISVIALLMKLLR